MSENQAEPSQSGIVYPANIETVASHLSVGVSTIKGWLTRLNVPHTRSDDLRGMRLFGPEAVEMLARFKALRDRGIPIDEAAKMVEGQGAAPAPSPAAPAADVPTDNAAIASPQPTTKELAVELAGEMSQALMPILRQTQEMAIQLGNLSHQLGEASATARLKGEELDRVRSSEEALRSQLAVVLAEKEDLARRLAEAEAKPAKKGWFFR